MDETAGHSRPDLDPLIEHCLKGATHGGVVSTQDAVVRLRGLMPSLDIPDQELINMVARLAIEKRLGVFFGHNG